MKRIPAIAALLAAALAAVALAATAGADSNANDHVLRSTLVGNDSPAKNGPTLFGVGPAGASWTVASSDVDARRDGRLDVEVEGLLLADGANAGTIGTVTTVTASLSCGGVSKGESDAVPLSPDGDAEIHAMLAPLDHACFAPTVFVHPRGAEGAYIAVTGA